MQAARELGPVSPARRPGGRSVFPHERYRRRHLGNTSHERAI